MRIYFSLIAWLTFGTLPAQTVSKKIQAAFLRFEKDSQVKHATLSLYVINAATGEVVFDKNANLGMAGASTQKIITAATAFDLLGKDFHYGTQLGYDGTIDGSTLNGNLYLLGSGDPTLGSWRWEQTRDSAVLREWVNAVKAKGIRRITGAVTTNTSRFAYQAIPDGWIWQDIGNYYGAGAYPLNWKENQFELLLHSENKLGGKVLATRDGKPTDYVNELKAAGKETGDNAYLYYDRSLSGTIPLGEKNFSISGADPDPVHQALGDFVQALARDSIQCRLAGPARSDYSGDTTALEKLTKFYTHYSPALDSIVYWFMKKSINLYGESLLKTLAFTQRGFGATQEGVDVLKHFWKTKNIDEDELNLYDGSGLSPLNRLTTHAQVEVLKYARSRDWFPYFYDALPEYNGMKIKSGTITDVKGYCGYHRSKSGVDYIFSFLVNDYSGSTNTLVSKMFDILDELK